MHKRSENFGKYIKSVAVTFAVLLTVLVTSALVLDGQRLLVAPQFIASLSFDEKVRFFRDAKLEQPQIVALGSSITMNHLDSKLLKNDSEQPVPLINFAAYGLQVSEFKDLAKFSARLFDKPETILVISTPVDFEICNPSEALNTEFYVSLKNLKQEDAIGYIKYHIPSLFYHAKYRSFWRMIDPGLLTKVRDLKKRNDVLESLQFDSGGSVLLNVSQKNVPPDRWNGLNWANTMGKLEPSNACYRSLQDFAEYVKQEGMQLVFVNSPIRQAYLERFDPQGQKIAFHQQQISTILKNYGFVVLDAQKDLPSLPDEFYADAMHLNQSGAEVLTRYISEQLNKTT